MQLHLAIVDLAHVKKLIHESQYAQTVSVHEIVQILHLRILFRLTQLLQRVHYESQRRTYFMGDVCEHLKSELLQLGFSLLYLENFSSGEVFRESQQYHDGCKDVECPSP